MNRVVVDASFCGALILQDECSEKADALLEEALIPSGPTLLTPGLWSYEMINLIRTARKRQRITDRQASEAIDLLHELPVQLIDMSSPETSQQIFHIAHTYDLSAYDASYFELASRLNVELFSNDRKLLNAFQNR